MAILILTLRRGLDTGKPSVLASAAGRAGHQAPELPLKNGQTSPNIDARRNFGVFMALLITTNMPADVPYKVPVSKALADKLQSLQSGRSIHQKGKDEASNIAADLQAKIRAQSQVISPPPVAARSTVEAFGNQSGKAAETASASAAQDTIPKLSAAQDTVGGSLSQRQFKVKPEELAKAYATVQIQDVDLAKDATNLAMQDIRSQMAASMVQKENHAAANVAQLVR